MCCIVHLASEILNTLCNFLKKDNNLFFIALFCNIAISLTISNKDLSQYVINAIFITPHTYNINKLRK